VNLQNVAGPSFSKPVAIQIHLFPQAYLGENILIHCKGGLGRAGMISGRLLVELGESPYEAIAKVRAARPGAIDTAAQENWVKSGSRA
jgi:hypothetical protein